MAALVDALPDVGTTLVRSTRLTYLKDTYLFQATAKVLFWGSGDRGTFLVLDETIFYPKGGGQPSDLGRIVFGDGRECSVTYVEFRPEDATVRHHVTGIEIGDDRIGSDVTLFVDIDRRIANAKAHTAGHLLAELVNSLTPELVGKIGFHDPAEGCYVKFQGVLVSRSPAELQEALNAKLAESLLLRAGVEHWEEGGATPGAEGDGAVAQLPQTHAVPVGKTCRFVQIAGFPPSPCGGTHIRSMSEVAGITCTKVGIVKKENVTKIAYTVQ
jgi:alanyl-tRNA synthetase